MNKRIRISAVFLLFILLFGCTSKEEAAFDFYERGRDFYLAKEYEKARLEFLNTIQRNPRFADAYYHLGLIAKHEGDIPLVYENMIVAMRMDENNVDAANQVAEIMLLGQHFNDALNLVEGVLIKDENNYDAKRIKAAAHIGRRDFNIAKEIIDQALKLRPRDASLYGLKAVIAREQEDLKSAEKNLERAVRLAENKTEYLVMLAAMHRDTHQLSELEKDYRALIKLNPNVFRFVNEYSRLLWRSDKYAEAEKFLTDYVRRQPTNYAAKIQLIETIARQDEKRAFTLLEKYISETPELTLKFFRIRWLVKLDEVSQALKELHAIAEENAQDVELRLKAMAMQAEILIREGKPRYGLSMLGRNLMEHPYHEQSLLLKAKIDLEEGRLDEATDSIRTVLRNNPKSEKALVLLGSVYSDSGSNLLADDAFRQALNLNPSNIDAAIPVVTKLLAKQNLERADAIISSALIERPSNIRLLRFLAQIRLMKRDWLGLKSTLDSLKQVDPDKSYGYYLNARILQGQRKHAEALEQFQASLHEKPSFVPALQGLTTAFLTLNKREQLLAYLHEFQKQHAKLIQAYVLAGQVLWSTGQKRSALKEIKRGIDAQPTWVKGYAILAGYQNELGESSDAIHTYKKGIALNENDVELKILLAAYYEKLARWQDAETIYVGLVEQHPDNILVLNNYVSLLLDKISSQANFQKALALAKPLADAEQPQFIDTYGWALVKNKQFQEAEQILRDASAQAPEIAAIRYHHGMALIGLERNAEAKRVLKNAQRYAKGDQELLKLIELSLWEL